MNDFRESAVSIGDLMKTNEVKRAFVRLTEEATTHNFAWEASYPDELRRVNETHDEGNKNPLLHHNDKAANEAIWKKAIACEAYEVRWLQDIEEVKWKPMPKVKTAALNKQLDLTAWNDLQELVRRNRAPQ